MTSVISDELNGIFWRDLRPRTGTRRERSGAFKYIDLYGSVHEHSGEESGRQAGDKRRMSGAHQCNGDQIGMD